MSIQDIGILIAALTASLGLVVSFTNWLRTQSVKDEIISGLKALSPPELAKWVRESQQIYVIRLELAEEEHARQLEQAKSQSASEREELESRHNAEQAAMQKELNFLRALDESLQTELGGMIVTGTSEEARTLLRGAIISIGGGVRMSIGTSVTVEPVVVPPEDNSANDYRSIN